MNEIKKKTVSPILIIGLLLYVAYSIIDRFITPLPDWIAIPVMLIAVVLIIIGVFKMRKQ